MKYKYIPHTADIEFQAFGESLEECFSNAAYAMTEIITKDQIKPVYKKNIKIKSKKKEILLVEFLEEFLFLLDTEGFVVSKIEEIKITGVVNKRSLKDYYDFELTAKVYFDNIKNYESVGSVKAVTYNDIFIKKHRVDSKDKFICQVVVDV